MEGKLGLRVGSDEHELDGQDSVYFDSSVPHAYRRVSKKSCKAVIVTS